MSSDDSYDDEYAPRSAHKKQRGQLTHRVTGPPGHRRLILK